jgi:hypothetical protein
MLYVNDSSRVWHVAKNGNNSNSGHAGQYPVNLANDAKLTIGAAVSAAADGDTIIIWPGTYDEAIDIDAANKALTIMGTNREKCIIYNQTNGGNGIKLEDGCELRNISVWSGTGDSVGGISATYKNRIIIDNVYARCNSIAGNTDGAKFNGSKDLRVSNSIFTCGFDGCVISSLERATFDNCVFITTGEYASGSVRGLLAGVTIYDVMFRNCAFYATRSADIDYAVFGAAIQGPATFIGCTFYAKTSGNCNANATALSANNGSFIGCGFYASATAGSSAYDIEGTNNYPVLAGCSFTSSMPVINGSCKIIDRKLSLDFSGRVDVGAIKGVDGDALIRAIKLLKNKAVQDKLTGAIRYYDDDGQTVILTHTPSEDESSMTRTVS